MIGCEILAGAPGEMASAVTCIIADGRSGAIDRSSVDDTAFRQPRQQPVGNQHCNADGNSERYHRTHHHFPSRTNIVHCETRHVPATIRC
jgi:hypothetical protein